MKAPIYNMSFEQWDLGTVDLSLEQEAAYLRLIHQMLRFGGAIPESMPLLCQIWRCQPNRAKTLLAALVSARKVVLQNGDISNRKAMAILEAWAPKKRKPKADKGDRNPKWKEFVSAYPARAGSNPELPGRNKFEAKVAAGVDPDDMIRGARAYRDEQAALGKVGTEYIRLYTTFLNQETWRQYLKSSARIDSEDRTRWARMLETERERGHWPFERESKSQIPAEFIEQWERDNPMNDVVVSLFDRKSA